jgi:hypothetical protein
MKRAQLYLWSVLNSVERLDEGILSELGDQAANHLPIADKKQRQADMNAAVGTWAERPDLPDSATYVSALRDEIRAAMLIPA